MSKYSSVQSSVVKQATAKAFGLRRVLHLAAKRCMISDPQPSPFFKAVAAYFTDEGLVLVSPDEASAQKAYCEAQLKGYKVKLEGDQLILLQFSAKKNNI